MFNILRLHFRMYQLNPGLEFGGARGAQKSYPLTPPSYPRLGTPHPSHDTSLNGSFSASLTQSQSQTSDQGQGWGGGGGWPGTRKTKTSVLGGARGPRGLTVGPAPFLTWLPSPAGLRGHLAWPPALRRESPRKEVRLEEFGSHFPSRTVVNRDGGGGQGLPSAGRYGHKEALPARCQPTLPIPSSPPPGFPRLL